MPGSADALFAELQAQIALAVDAEPQRPWCVHRLYEEVTRPTLGDARDDGLLRTRYAADGLAESGKVRRESISAVSIGVHCEDSLYWSCGSHAHELTDFGPEYDAPRLLHRLASHFQCHGL